MPAQRFAVRDLSLLTLGAIVATACTLTVGATSDSDPDDSGSGARTNSSSSSSNDDGEASGGGSAASTLEGGSAGAGGSEPAAEGGSAGESEPSAGASGSEPAAEGGSAGESESTGGAAEPVMAGSGGIADDCGESEVCGNGIDDDCNGSVDDGCATALACQYTADQLPADDGWNLVGIESDANADIDEGLLHLVDDSTASGSRLLWGRDCFDSMETDSTYVFEARLRSVESSDYAGFLLQAGLGTNAVELTLFPDGIMFGGGLSCDQHFVDHDLTELVTLRLEIVPAASGTGTVATYVNGTEIDHSTPCAESAPYAIVFGMGSRTGTAEGYIDEITAWAE